MSKLFNTLIRIRTFRASFLTSTLSKAKDFALLIVIKDFAQNSNQYFTFTHKLQ